MNTCEHEIDPRQLETLARMCASTFCQRRDVYARQLEDGSYVCIRQPLRMAHVLAHLRGELTLGAYLLDRDSRARFIVLDADEDSDWAKLMYTATRLAQEGIPAYLETSRRGGHLWLFLAQPVAGHEARAFGRGIMAIHALDEIELYPKQDRLAAGPGSLIRLPFGIHRKSGRRYGFVQPDGSRLAASLSQQIGLLAQSACVPAAGFEAYQSVAIRQGKRQRPHPSRVVLKRVFAASEAASAPLSERIKASITVHELVSHYVALSPAGVGLCPFHEDHHPSFAVSEEGNYWHCFSCGVGGSVIDFWMRWRKCNFVTAVRELADMLFSS
jgi:hypothetical protein